MVGFFPTKNTDYISSDAFNGEKDACNYIAQLGTPCDFKGNTSKHKTAVGENCTQLPFSNGFIPRFFSCCLTHLTSWAVNIFNRDYYVNSIC